MHERVYRDKRASVYLSAARNKERFSSRGVTAYEPVVNRSLCSSIGLNRILFVRASGERFWRRVFDALGGTRDACFLGELFCRRPVLPGLARRPAVRPDPTRPWYVQVLESTNLFAYCLFWFPRFLEEFCLFETEKSLTCFA